MTTRVETAAPQLVVMLTYNDFTIGNAEEIFEQARDSMAVCWGMKEQPLPPERMKALFRRMKECGKTTALEVVGYDGDAATKGARLAAECGCDMLMGTKFHQPVADFCRENGIRYLPFVGTISGRPSVLTGTIGEIIAEAKDVIRRGAYGVDLLGYRYAGDAVRLNRELVDSLGNEKVCIAGSVDSLTRLDEIKETAPWAFTIGSAFFDKKFGGSVREQIDKVCRYMEYENSHPSSRRAADSSGMP